MKKIVLGIVGLSLLLLAAVAFARPGGVGPNAGNISPEQKQFFDATRDLRKDMHDKRFELMELSRTGADQSKIDALENEIEALRTKIQSKAAEFGIEAGPGACGNQGAKCATGRGCIGQARNCDRDGTCANQQARMNCGNMSRCGQQ